MTSAYDRSEKASHLHTIHYEINMLHYCGRRLDELGLPRDEASKAEFNVFLECFLLHYRNLVRFFSGKEHFYADPNKPKQTSDLSTREPRVWAGRDLTAEEMRTMCDAAAPLDGDYFQPISQYLQHVTERRFAEKKFWDYRDLYKSLRPIIDAFLKSFPRTARRTLHAQISDTGSSTATIVSYDWHF